ncbi:hypothetical protein FQR65_LT04981 [Abscondita terminalis]|nr:hypothetical protein FQR65_LT04981 [Abscondita terminalis]
MHKSLKIFLNTNDVIEICNVTVLTNKCCSLDAFKNELAKQIHELYEKNFVVKWRNAKEEELEVSCDEDFDEFFPHAAVLYVYVTPTFVRAKENKQPAGCQLLMENLPTILDSFSKSKHKERLTELTEEIVKILESEVERKMYEGLAQLQQMGFQDDRQYMMHLLSRYQGNVAAVVNAIKSL